MKAIEAYQAVDGTIFTDSDKAQSHNLDCIGQEFDALLISAVDASNGHVTRIDQHLMVMWLLENRSKVKPIIDTLATYLNDESKGGDCD